MRGIHPGPRGNHSIVYVNPVSRASSADGDSWGTAYTSLSESLQGDLTEKEEIWVAGGTYTPTENADLHASFMSCPCT
jgi:hypothetical protein